MQHVNEVALELFEKEQHRLKIKIELQSFLWKVVEATKLRTTHISVHMIFLNIIGRIILIKMEDMQAEIVSRIGHLDVFIIMVVIINMYGMTTQNQQ